MPRNFRSLKKPKIRPDWNKATLYNLSRLQIPPAATRTFFQQKWLAKSMLRGYHNPDVREKKWERLFDRRLPAVVPMSYKYLAETDGREVSAGRGSGLLEDMDQRDQQRAERKRVQGADRTPYMSMLFFPLERRLDTSIWRALFASSIRQARQMVIHGFVKVNGKKMIHPGYRLNPGDLFSIDPDRVLFATGAKKVSAKRISNSSRRQTGQASEVEAGSETEESAGANTTGEEQTSETTLAADVETSVGDGDGESQSSMSSEEYKDARGALKTLRARAKRILEGAKTDLSAKRLRELRSYNQSLQKSMSRFGRKGGNDTEAVLSETVESFESALKEIVSQIPDDALPSEKPNTSTSSDAKAREAKAGSEVDPRKDAELLMAALERVRENPIDLSKPYATPWRPRKYMSAFAFIPRYLEVNHNICSAVYLRHPVARPGLAEIPSPFHPETSQLGFNWYLRRR